MMLSKRYEFFHKQFQNKRLGILLISYLRFSSLSSFLSVKVIHLKIKFTLSGLVVRGFCCRNNFLYVPELLTPKIKASHVTNILLVFKVAHIILMSNRYYYVYHTTIFIIWLYFNRKWLEGIRQ